MKNGKEKGSITLFVVVACIFIIGIIITLVMRVGNRNINQEKSINNIQDEYQVNNQILDDVYNNQIKNTI